MALRVLNKEWNGVADAIIDEGVESGAMIVCGSKIMQWPTGAKKERSTAVRRVVFLLNITKVGMSALQHQQQQRGSRPPPLPTKLIDF